MKRENIVLENKKGEAIRVLNWHSKKMYAVLRNDTSRLDFTDDLESFEKNLTNLAKVDAKSPAARREKFKVIATIERDSLKKHPAKLGAFGQIRLISDADDLGEMREEVAPTAEETKVFPLFIRYSSIAHMCVLGVLLISAWVMHKYFEKPAPQAVTVQVFEQHVEEAKQHTPIVNVAEHKIAPQKQKNIMSPTKVTNKRVQIRHNNVAVEGSAHGHGSGRPGTSLQNTGALGVLGGMGTQYHGSGGLNLNAKTDGPGIGYGGPAMRGGFARGLIGKGLIATGAGDGSGTSLRGYGGTATSGLGGGRPGYGTMHMAGSSGAYFEPLGEESLVEGGLDRDQINSVIQRNIGQVTYCYEQGLQSNPGLSGRVAVKFVIGSHGSVESAKVANASIGSGQVEGCIVQKLRGWKFPQPTGNVSVRVTYPFVLKRLSQG
jgi:TonB family protein